MSSVHLGGATRYGHSPPFNGPFSREEGTAFPVHYTEMFITCSGSSMPVVLPGEGGQQTVAEQQSECPNHTVAAIKPFYEIKGFGGHCPREDKI